MTVEQLESEILTLPRGERARLVERLISSLDEEQDEILQAWEEEAERRYQEYLRGEGDVVPAAEFFAEIRAELTQ